MFIFLLAGAASTLALTACSNGASTPDPTATAVAPATATAQPAPTTTPQPTPNATPQPAPTATPQPTPTAALQPAIDPISQLYIDIYSELSTEDRAALDAANIDEAEFVFTMTTLGDELRFGMDDPNYTGLIRIFGAIGDREVTFLPPKLAMGLSTLIPDLLEGSGAPIDKAALARVRAGEMQPTGSMLSILFQVSLAASGS